ncbi:hypothetical protein [Oceanobacillus oncorhynchi]|uniref:hypothetical protein n=1 Tax=Oceanobacillus oncorhynchi TaxID=545501 RepID=UPI0034D56400
MSRNGTKRETIFTLYLKKYHNVLEEIIGIPIERITMEYNNGSHRIDLHGVNKEKKIEIFVECQITPSDLNHLNQIKDLINDTAEGYVIWIASKFRKSTYLEEVKEMLQNNPRKYINFFAIEIDPSVIQSVKQLDKQYELEVFTNLNIINDIPNPLNLVDYYLQMPPTHIGQAFIGEQQYDFARDDDIKDYFLDKLLERMPYFLNFHSTKKSSLNSKIMQIGAGLGGVMYNCSAQDTKNRAFVEIRFERSRTDWYEYFKKNEVLLRREINQLLLYNDYRRSIGYYIDVKPGDVVETVNFLVNVFERFIIFFSTYTYGGKLKQESLV